MTLVSKNLPVKRLLSTRQQDPISKTPNHKGIIAPQVTRSAIARCKFFYMFSSTPHIAGAEMLMQGVTIVRAGREPCPVCGHPTGDCSGDTSKAPPVKVNFGPVEEPKRDEPDVLVKEDIWKDVQLTSRTKTRVLVAKAGSYIPVSLAREHGLID